MTIQRSTWQQGEVIENKAWTERLFTLRIRMPQQPFKAGQFIRLQLPINTGDGDNDAAETVAKSYSLVNAPQEADDVVEVFYNTVPDGRLSNALAALQVGDSIEVSQPANGFFVLDEVPEAKHLWLFATGTGLGPYISILKTADVWQRFDKIVLVHGVPLRAELAYGDLIQQWQEQYSEQFQFVSCVTQEENPDGLETRITTALADGSLEKVAGLTINKDDSHVMLCGNHAMINDMKSLLAEHHMEKHLRHKPGQITTEQYF